MTPGSRLRATRTTSSRNSFGYGLGTATSFQAASQQARSGVTQPCSSPLPLAVARDTGCRVAYLPGLSMRRIADLYPGEAKTDARDAYVIADAARTMPHTLRAVEAADETVAELEMLTGFD
ncbi:IS110 family transposase [Streptomyces sp. ME02-6985-2c]|uniref:IS110 family transposase n=1 Tax=Streptomyces sp. ME02-6985-2c TaxID=3028675 RepID=UPI0039F6E93F